jgi:hypothetical protein
MKHYELFGRNEKKKRRSVLTHRLSPESSDYVAKCGQVSWLSTPAGGLPIPSNAEQWL